MIPGTSTSEVRAVQWRKVSDDGTSKMYRAKDRRGYLCAMVSRDPAGPNGEQLWHISISHRDENDKPDRPGLLQMQLCR